VVAIVSSFPYLPVFAPVSWESSSTKEDSVAYLTDTLGSPNDGFDEAFAPVS
jgi:hypothetical protein